MMAYRPLPVPPACPTDSDAGAYGLQLFRWLISTDACTASLTDNQLALADHAGARASAVPGLSAAVYDRLSRVRHAVASALRARAAYDADQVDQVQPGPCDAGRPNLGHMAPLMPAPIVRPPSGQAVRLTPADRAAVADRIAF